MTQPPRSDEELIHLLKNTLQKLKDLRIRQRRDVAGLGSDQPTELAAESLPEI